MPRRAASPGILAGVRAAAALLTRMPVATVSADAPGGAAFALVGAVLGGLAAMALVPLAVAGEPMLGAIAAVAVFAAASGGLHLDGLADTADALMAPDAVGAERARQDPAVGPGGAATLLLVLGAQVAALASLTASSGPVVAASAAVVAGAVSRWSPVLAVVLLRRRVRPDGLGAWFSDRVSGRDALVGAVTVAVVVAATIPGGWIAGGPAATGDTAVLGLAAAAGAATAVVATALVVRARGGLDGDGLGAAVEIALTATLVGLALIPR